MAHVPGDTVKTDSPIRVDDVQPGLVRLILSVPKGNVLDSRMIEALTRFFVAAKDQTTLKAVVLEGEGAHFSFGASVEEHRRDRVADMLRTFRGLFRSIADAAVPVLAAVRGQCLGGGLELAAYCHRVFASQDATLGQPEIKLGVFAPIASLVLPERVGRGHAEDLLLSGRSWSAAAAHAAGLVDELAEDPSAAAIAHAERHLLPLSGSSLRLAVRAARAEFDGRFFAGLARIEELYVRELMATEDANEGITSFLEKRAPQWRNA